MTIFIFANSEKVRKSTEQRFLLVENRPTVQNGFTIDILVGRTYRMVTIVQLQSLRSNSREFVGVSGGFYYPPEWQPDCSSSGFKNPEGSREKTENSILTFFSFLVSPEMNLNKIDFIFRVCEARSLGKGLIHLRWIWWFLSTEQKQVNIINK